MYITSTFLVLSALYAKETGELFSVLFTGECFYYWPGLTVLRGASTVLRKFCPLRYEQVIGMSRCRVKD